MTSPEFPEGAAGAAAWNVVVERTCDTGSSLVAYGRRGDTPVVLKLLKAGSDEWRSGEMLTAMQGPGVVRLLESAPGALLLERLDPGYSLAEWAAAGRDDDATDVIAGLLSRMTPRVAPDGTPTVADWGQAFARHAGSPAIAAWADLALEASHQYTQLASSQTSVRLLHGDLQHSNVLFDQVRGWTVIDPKGVVGELEFEVGAMLRNPVERPDLFASPAFIERRVSRLAARLALDPRRILGWAFAQAVLSALWAIEDGAGASSVHSSLRLAEAIRPMLARDS